MQLTPFKIVGIVYTCGNEGFMVVVVTTGSTVRASSSEVVTQARFHNG